MKEVINAVHCVRMQSVPEYKVQQSGQAQAY